MWWKILFLIVIKTINYNASSSELLSCSTHEATGGLSKHKAIDSSKISRLINLGVEHESDKTRMKQDSSMNGTEVLSALKRATEKYDWNDPNNRYSPNDFFRNTPKRMKYQISEVRLKEIRSHLLYPFHDMGNPDGYGDYQKDLHSSTAQIPKSLNFTLPFFGISYDYVRVSMNGFLEFSDPPPQYTYPLVFPTKGWPKKNDPAFIGIFHSKCRIGEVNLRDRDQREPGVYYSVHSNLDTRLDQYSIELRERLLWDIREGIIGSETFVPKHAIIVTWKNMTFAGGLDITLKRTNTFQVILVTDEIFTYTIFNYADINWSSHTEAGGDTVKGEGGTQAFIGFNAGNGTRSFEYKPYSQSEHIYFITEQGLANGHPGRHIFRIDEKILPGSCNIDQDSSDPPLYIAPESGNMLGGTIVNVSGPCFTKSQPVRCIFGTIEVQGIFVDHNRAICIQPFLRRQGYINLDVRIGTDERRTWHAKYFVETSATTEEMIWFNTSDVYKKTLISLVIGWKAKNLTQNVRDNVQISLYGYKEETHELIFIDTLAESIINSGEHTFTPHEFRDRRNDEFLGIEVGLISINLASPPKIDGVPVSTALWSKPIPLAWYFGPQWRRKHGNLWPEALCKNWVEKDNKMENYANFIPICPCTLDHVVNDKGRFLPDFSCKVVGNDTICFENDLASNCFKSGLLSSTNAEQQCCYDKQNFLMLNSDQIGGSRPKRRHNNAYVPSVSQFSDDIAPFYYCCLWQTENSDSCEAYRYEMRSSQNCVGYQPPAIGSVFGDPHVVTFDGLEYTFNGVGEFVLLKSVETRDHVEIQGRFEQMARSGFGEVKSAYLSSVVVKGNSSVVIEVRLRSKQSMRYRLDVLINGRTTYFDKPSMKQQFMKGVTVYTPFDDLNQSTVIVMLESGIGVEMKENVGLMSVLVYLPWNYINKTRGLLGNFNWNTENDLILPNEKIISINTDNFEILHREFAMKWLLSDKHQEGVGVSLFLREYGRTSDFYTNDRFQPNFIKEPRDFLPNNQSEEVKIAKELCEESYQCRYDYGMTFNTLVAENTKHYYKDLIKSKEINREQVISCGTLDTPRYGYKSNYSFINGTTVGFSCHEGFIIRGDPIRTCTDDGRWSKEVHGFTSCIRNEEQIARTTGVSLAIILFIIVPLSLISIIFLKQYFKTLKREQDEVEQEKRWKEIEMMRLQQQELIEAVRKERDEDYFRPKESETEEKVDRFIETPL